MVHSWPGYVAEPPAWDMAWRNCHRHGVHHTHQTSFPQQSTAEILPYQAHPLWGSRFSASAASLQPPAIFFPPHLDALGIGSRAHRPSACSTRPPRVAPDRCYWRDSGGGGVWAFGRSHLWDAQCRKYSCGLHFTLHSGWEDGGWCPHMNEGLAIS